MKERIRKLRRSLDMTQQEFADRIGIKRNTIANYENGRNDPVDSVVSLICREFNVNENWLRTGEGDMFVERTRDEQIASFFEDLQSDTTDPFKRQFILTLSALDDAEWEMLKNVVQLFQLKKD